MKKYKPRFMPELGETLRAIREELGLTLREVGKLLGVDHMIIYNHEQKGFCEPPWARYAEIYAKHPDLKDARSVVMSLALPDLLENSKLFRQLISLYGMMKLPEVLQKKSTQMILKDLGEKLQAWEWTDEDIMCMKRRVGIDKRRPGRYKNDIR